MKKFSVFLFCFCGIIHYAYGHKVIVGIRPGIYSFASSRIDSFIIEKIEDGALKGYNVDRVQELDGPFKSIGIEVSYTHNLSELVDSIISLGCAYDISNSSSPPHIMVRNMAGGLEDDWHLVGDEKPLRSRFLSFILSFGFKYMLEEWAEDLFVVCKGGINLFPIKMEHEAELSRIFGDDYYLNIALEKKMGSIGIELGWMFIRGGFSAAKLDELHLNKSGNISNEKISTYTHQMVYVGINFDMYS